MSNCGSYKYIKSLDNVADLFIKMNDIAEKLEDSVTEFKQKFGSIWMDESKDLYVESLLEDEDNFDEDGEFLEEVESQCLSCYNRKKCGICRFPERSCKNNEGDCWDYLSCNNGGDNFEDSNY